MVFSKKGNTFLLQSRSHLVTKLIFPPPFLPWFSGSANGHVRSTVNLISGITAGKMDPRRRFTIAKMAEEAQFRDFQSEGKAKMERGSFPPTLPPPPPPPPPPPRLRKREEMIFYSPKHATTKKKKATTKKRSVVASSFAEKLFRRRWRKKGRQF